MVMLHSAIMALICGIAYKRTSGPQRLWIFLKGSLRHTSLVWHLIGLIYSFYSYFNYLFIYYTF